jgi:hypothetical protein
LAGSQTIVSGFGSNRKDLELIWEDVEIAPGRNYASYALTYTRGIMSLSIDRNKRYADRSLLPEML